MRCGSVEGSDSATSSHLRASRKGKERCCVCAHTCTAKKKPHGQDIPTKASSSTLRTVLDQLAEKIKLHLSPFGFAALVLMKVWQ